MVTCQDLETESAETTSEELTNLNKKNNSKRVLAVVESQLISQIHFRFELANQSHFCRTAKRFKLAHDKLGARNVSI
jgi:hypothetical protein